MTETINMSNIINAEMQHEIDAIETAQKWREWCKKARAEGRIK
jgi:post-segregation antitoxin (ccd killing protein)